MSVPALSFHCWPAGAVAGGLRQPDNLYQGWVEANLIFVAPDEVGRVQTLSVREGDVVKAGDELFTVDDDLQRADFAQVKASLTNAQQTYDRASSLLKSGAGTQKDYDAARGDVARRAGAAQFRADPAVAAARFSARSTAPCSKSISVPAKWCRRAGRCCRCCRPATSKCGSTCLRRGCRPSPMAINEGRMRRLRQRSDVRV